MISYPKFNYVTRTFKKKKNMTNEANICLNLAIRTEA